MKKLNTLNLVLSLAIIVSVGAIVLQRYLPARTLELVPGEHHLNTFSWLSAPQGSKTRFEFLDQSGYQWRCVSEAVDEWLICSLSISLTEDTQGLDLSRYSTLNLKLNYTGSARKMRVGLRHWDERFSTPDDGNSTKFQYLILREEDFNNPVSLALSEFIVAEWWIEQYELPRHLAQPDMSNVVSLAIEFIGGLEPGSHEVTLESLSFSGDLISPEHWYLGILGLWILIGLTVVGVRMIRLAREGRQAKQQITELAVSNSRLQTEKSRLQTLSHLDALTGINNRYAIDKSIAQLLAEPRQRTVALILMDIDHFKRINDRRGHAVGDKILQQFALLVGSNIRSQDVFGRWGGEEFLLICPDSSIDNAFYLAEKIRRIISETLFEEEKPMAVTASFGVSTILPDEDFMSAFRRVDTALYKAKFSGRNCTIIADTTLPDSLEPNPERD